MTTLFNPACYNLAEQFCPDGTPKAKVNELAAGIQDYIEDWLSIEQREVDLKEAAGDWRAK